MGYGYYTLPDGREAGYGVEAECDQPECSAEIDRGLGYLCGRNPDGHRDDDEPGCGHYFCMEHLDDHDCPNPNGWAECLQCDGVGNIQWEVIGSSADVEQRGMECPACGGSGGVQL